MVDQIRFDSGGTGQKVDEKIVVKIRVLMEEADEVSFSNRTASHVDTVVTGAKRSGFPVRARSPQNWSGPRIATTASSPRLETTVALTLPSWI